MLRVEGGQKTVLGPGGAYSHFLLLSNQTAVYLRARIISRSLLQLQNLADGDQHIVDLQFMFENLSVQR